MKSCENQMIKHKSVCVCVKILGHMKALWTVFHLVIVFEE